VAVAAIDFTYHALPFDYSSARGRRFAGFHAGCRRSSVPCHAAEIVAHDPPRNASSSSTPSPPQWTCSASSTPPLPVKVGSIDVKPYGAVANSVAVRDGIIAVAVENDEKTSPGKAVFFDRNLNFVSQVTVGALPDMLTFTPNGRFVLVANEGEPNEPTRLIPKARQHH
jgi:2',3'-cyclic-nucleotide 2'-phosphodiesterase / 3'-nucleotidase / 5'-nucleotidase